MEFTLYQARQTTIKPRVTKFYSVLSSGVIVKMMPLSRAGAGSERAGDAGGHTQHSGPGELR